MNEMVKNIAIFAAGTSVGIFFAQKVLEKQSNESIEETFIKRGDHHEERSVNNIYHQKSSLDGTVTNEYNKIKRDYGIVEEYDEGEETEEDDFINEFEAPSPENNKNKPYVIEETDFLDNMKHYNKISLYYYAQDDVLSDVDEIPITNVDAVVGDETINTLSSANTYNVIYVRNNRLETDYEIIALNQSYQEQILGLLPGEQRPRKNERKNLNDE